MAKGRRRRRGRRRRPGKQQKPEDSAQRDLETSEGSSRRKRKRRRSRRRRKAETFQGFLESKKMKQVQTLPPDGLELESLIAGLKEEYGTPATPQEYRLVIKFPEGSGSSDGKEADSNVLTEKEPESSNPPRRGRRRRRRRDSSD